MLERGYRPYNGAKSMVKKDGAMNNDEIARETLRFVDDNGLEAVSFRKISQATGVPTMTICNRFGSKGQLLRATLAAMLDEAGSEEPLPDESWDETLRRVARHNRAMALEHPKAFPLFFQVPPFESPMKEYTERVFSLHQGQGIDERLPFAFLGLMHAFLTGFQMAELYTKAAENGDDVSPEAQLFVRLYNEESFERDLDIIIRGFAATYNLPLNC